MIVIAWFKVDDGFYDNPKVVGLSHEAVALWLLGGTWASKQLTDGSVPSRMIARLGCTFDAAEELVDVGLWDRINGDYEFHDWEDYQPTRAVVEERRRVRAEAGRKGGLKSGESRREANASAEATDEDEAKANPVPSRPVPDYYSPSKSQSSSNRARVSTDAIEVSEWTRKLAAQKGITSLRVVVDAIHAHTSCTVTADQAWQLSLMLLDRAKEWPTAEQRYVLACIKQNPAEIEQTLYEQIGVAS